MTRKLILSCCYITLLKPETSLNIVRSPNSRLLGLNGAAFCCCSLLACCLRIHGAFSVPTDAGVWSAAQLLEFEAEELPDVVESASTLVATTGLAITLESNCERKPRLKKEKTNKNKKKKENIG